MEGGAIELTSLGEGYIMICNFPKTLLKEEEL